MEYGLWLSAGGLQAMQYRQDIIANNLANVNTAGFKRDLAVFSERMIAAREGTGDSTASDETLNPMTGGIFVAPTYTIFEQGAVEPTERPLDAALVGDGFFTVRNGDKTAYTRDGRFAVNSSGELVTASGNYPVLNADGSAIRIPAHRASEVQFTQDGRVRVGNNDVSRLGIVDFEDHQQLRKVGTNLFEAAEGANPKNAAATVEGRSVEASSVDPATTMVSMIEASRAYQLNATMIQMQDSLLGRAVNDIARLR